MDRRRFLKLGAVLTCSSSVLPGCDVFESRTRFTSAATDYKGNHFMIGLSADLKETFRLSLPERAHEVRYNPVTRHVVAFARRPGKYLFVYDTLSQKIIHKVKPQASRLFYGHGDFDESGRFLFATENDYENKRGVIGVYDSFSAYEKVSEFNAFGIGSHEIRYVNNELIVANGGILTHPDAPRKKLNIAEMRPNITRIDAKTGALIGQYELLDHQASVRHIDVKNGQVAIGLQHQTHSVENSPITAFYSKDQLSAQNACKSLATEMQHYIASVALGDDGQVVYTAPRGNRVLVVDSKTDRLLKAIKMRDVAGVAFDPERSCYWLTAGTGVIIPLSSKTLSFGKGKSFSGLKWDNHLRYV